MERQKKRIFKSFIFLILFNSLMGCASIRSHSVSEQYSILIKASTEGIQGVDSSSRIILDNMCNKISQGLEARLKEKGYKEGRYPLILAYHIDEYRYGYTPPFLVKTMIVKYTITVIDEKTKEVIFATINTDAHSDTNDLISEMIKNIYSDGIKGIYKIKSELSPSIMDLPPTKLGVY